MAPSPSMLSSPSSTLTPPPPPPAPPPPPSLYTQPQPFSSSFSSSASTSTSTAPTLSDDTVPHHTISQTFVNKTTSLTPPSRATVSVFRALPCPIPIHPPPFDQNRARMPHDAITALSFNHTGDLLAVGDESGRMIFLKRSSYRRQQYGQHPAYISSPFSSHLHSQCDDNFVSQDENDDDDDDDDDDYDLPGVVFPDMDDLPPRRSFSRPRVKAPKYRPWTEFQSHEGDFDLLQSSDVQRSINRIVWCSPVAGSYRLVAANDRIIKVWRITERDLKMVTHLHRPSKATRPQPVPFPSRRQPFPSTRFSRISLARDYSPWAAPSYSMNRVSHPDAMSRSPSPPPRARNVLHVPKLRVRGRHVTASSRRTFSNLQMMHTNSVSLSSDEETLLSSDDLNIHLWHMHAHATGVKILDINPSTYRELTEVITSSQFHPHHSSLFAHSTTRGTIKLCDLRSSAKCRSFQKVYEDMSSRTYRKSFISELISSISDLHFSPDGRYMLTRDYMQLKLWDVNLETSPILTIPVHEHVRPRLDEMYESDHIFDKFECRFSADASTLVTGSYNSSLQCYSAATGEGSALEVGLDDVMARRLRLAEAQCGHNQGNNLDATRRVLHMDTSPTDPLVAAASGAGMYLYHQAPDSGPRWMWG